MRVFSQGLKNALEPQKDDDDADILKVLQCFVRSNTLFQIYDQNSRQMTSSKNVCDVITLISAIFGLEPNCQLSFTI